MFIPSIYNDTYLLRLWLVFLFSRFKRFNTRRLCNGANPQVSILARRCFCKLELHVNRFSHPSHLYNLTPTCASSCRLWSVTFLNPLPQWEHVNGFSPVWIRICTQRLCLLFKILPHVSHANDSLTAAPSVCFLMCLLKFWRPQNRDEQTSHE